MKTQSRRGLLKDAAGVAVGAAGLMAVATPPVAEAKEHIDWEKKAVQKPGPDGKVAPPGDKPPLFSSIVTFGNLVFLAGVGAHFDGTIEEHTKHVLDELEENLKLAGSSMEKVLKVNVYLNDIKDWPRMNTVYQGRWGAVPPVRTTVAPAGGIPGGSLVEIDLIAYK